MKTILKDDGSHVTAPRFIGVNAEKNTIYVLDRDKGCYGLTMDDQVLCHYQNPEAKSYFGLAVDSNGLFISSRVAKKFQVEKLSFSGEQEVICTIFGDSYPLKVMENELVLCAGDHSSGILINFY